MSVLEQIGAFGQGAVSGFNQGLDLYEKYAQITDQAEARGKRQRIEGQINDYISKNGMKDPVAALNEFAGYYMEAGLTDDYLKYSQAAQGIQNTNATRAALRAYQLAEVDPRAAVPVLNEFAQTMQTGDSFQLMQTPSGARLVATINGQKVDKEYAGETAVAQFHHDVMKYLAPYTMELNKAQADIAQSQSATELARAQTEQVTQLTPAKVASEQAAAASASALAGKYSTEARIAQEQNPYQIDALIARAEEARRGEAESVYDIAENAMPPAEPPLDGAPDPTTDRATMAAFARALQDANPGMPGGTAFSTARLLATTDLSNANVEDGTLLLPDGTAHKLGPQGVQHLVNIHRARAASLEE